MAIKTEDVGFKTSTTIYTSIDETALTFMSLCNHTVGNITCDIHAVPSGDVADAGNLMITALEIVAGDTYILYEGNEKIFLANSDSIQVAPSGTGTDPVAVTTTVNGVEYGIATLGDTDFTLIGGVSTTTGAFGSGQDYIITNVGDTDFTLIGAASNTVGVIFTATGVGDGTTGTALEQVFTATGAGTGTGTVKLAVVTVITSYMGV